MVSSDSSVSHIKQLLSDPTIQNELAVLLSYYYDEVHVISDIAASECQGIRPSGLENEVYACLHHIARGLATLERDQAADEIRKGNRTHLKRLHLDAYKIAINSFLTEYAELVSSLRFFVLEDAFRKIDPEGSVKAIAISDTAGMIKKNYLEARKLESAGKHSEALDLFLEVLTSCYDLRKMIHELTQGNLYQIAVSYMEKLKRDEKHKEWRSYIINFVVAVVSSGVTFFLSKLF